MEIKLSGIEDKENKYFDDLLTKIREIRASERTPRQKVADIISLAMDYDKEGAVPLLSLLNSRMTALGTNGDLRLRWAECHHPLTMKSIEEQQRYWLMDADNNQHIYEYPSFSGIYEDDEEEEDSLVPETMVSLPKELEGFKGGSMILKIEDMDRFIDTFCSRNTYYRRAYDILAELDKQVLESLEEGAFPQWTDVEYKDGGWANFEFSHFEVDLREPDSQYRTLYVRLSGEDYGVYYARLLAASYRASEAVKIHETWKRRLMMGSGVREVDCKQRILVVLKELLKSDFLRSEYIDTGVPKDDCKRAVQEIRALSFEELLEIEGADWKYALLSQQMRKPEEKRVLVDENRAGFYIDEMHEKLNNEDVEVFLWFATLTRLAYQELDQIRPARKKDEDKTPEQKAVEDFVGKIISLAESAYDEYNGKMVSPGVNQAEVKITILKDNLISLMEIKKKNKFDELLTLCYPVNGKSKARFCKYISQLQRKDYFGKLPNNLLAALLAPIVGLKEGSVKNYLSQT